MSTPPSIHLFDTVGLGLIIEDARGASYSNQTGGTSCLQPTAVGYYVPLRNDRAVTSHVFLSPELELLAYFEGPRHAGAGATSGLDEEDANYVDAVLQRCGLSAAVSVDRTRLRESHEAWVRVTIHSDESDSCPVFSGFAPFPRTGVLTWTNSD